MINIQNHVKTKKIKYYTFTELDYTYFTKDILWVKNVPMESGSFLI